MSRTVLALCLALAAPVAACDTSGGDGAPPTGLQLSVYTSPQAGNPYDNVAWLRIAMHGDGIVQPVEKLVAYQPGVQVNLDGAPFSKAGESRQLVVEGWSANATGQPAALVSRGRSFPTEVRAGALATTLKVLFARVNQFLTVVSVADRAPQRLNEGRLGLTATPTNAGEVVFAGGGEVVVASAKWWAGADFAKVLQTVEALDLSTQVVSPRAPMLQPRAWHTATALSSGQVILAGGYGAGGDALNTVELYNPPGVLDGTAKTLPNMKVSRAGHTATMIDEVSRTILFVGGDADGTWELWDPMTGSPGGTHPLADSLARRHHAATTFYLPGRAEPAVFIAGGETATGVLATGMLYDSVARSMVPIGGPMPSGGRTQATATLVPSRGFIYVAGGFTDVNRAGATGSIEVFDIGTLGFLQGNENFRMRTGRGGHSAVLMPDNAVLLAGGIGSEPPTNPAAPLASVEVIHEFLDATQGVLRIEVASSWNTDAAAAQVPYMAEPRVGQRAVALGNGMALIVGGEKRDTQTGGFTPVRDVILYNPF
ncbi:MAG: hypothetical protein KC635_13275 [Myxococcales bacterium]|nr:hypothetical protein [Myxococcales bacterium]MCB9734283.1 hypothetical protein [Deltaproteobacteria bacterium]